MYEHRRAEEIEQKQKGQSTVELYTVALGCDTRKQNVLPRFEEWKDVIQLKMFIKIYFLSYNTQHMFVCLFFY